MGKMASNLVTWIFTLWCIWNGARATKSTKEDTQNVCLEASNYKDALRKGILFFQGQRSGKLPANQRVKWRGDSALSDGNLENVNLRGGYYDGGDNVKFGWPMAFSICLLSWSASEYRNQIIEAAAGADADADADELQASIRWGTNFLLKAHQNTNNNNNNNNTCSNSNTLLLYTQVGDPNRDHQCWERPEDMDTPRTLYKITSSSPGTEPAAEAAAALAAASIVFKGLDSNYSALLLTQSKSLFEFADKYRGSYQGSCPFYCSYSGYQDELLWGAVWLYKASGDNKYLNYASNNEAWSQPANEFSWDNKFAGAQILLTKEYLAGKTNLANYKTGADSFVCALMPGSSSAQIKTTPGGLLYTRDSSNLQYATSASMILLFYSNILSAAHVNGVQCGSVNFSTSKIKDFAKSQVDYILGNNPMKMSYMVGFGNKYPTQLHHRGASIPSIYNHSAKIGCNDGYSTWYTSSKPNPNTHVGAIVGGPNSNDQFTDSRTDYSHLEPTTYINAAFVGSVAALINGQSKEENCLPLHLQMSNNYDNKTTSNIMVYI